MSQKAKRLRGVTVDKAFVYGTVSRFLKKTDDQHHFAWTVYLRGLDNEDLSYFIRRVTFSLHESFAEPVRVCDAPPFEVTEQGWGEFVIGLTVQFRDGTLRQMDLQHNLRLFPDAQQQRDLPIERRRPVVAERFDEFVFVDPSEEFHAALIGGPRATLPPNALGEFWSKERFADDERRQLASLSATHQSVLRQIAKTKAEMRDMEAETAAFREQLAAIGAAKAHKK